MKQRHLIYGLKNGYVHDWLVLGPAIIPITAQPEADEGALAYRARLLKAADHAACDFPRPPQEIEKIERFGEPLYWEAEHCQDDHLLEKNITAAVYSYARAWAFTRFSCSGAKSVTMSLTLCCPASVWLNGRHVKYCEHVTALEDQTAQTYTFTASLKPDSNGLLVRMEQVVAGDAVLAMAVRVDSPHAAKVKVKVPTITEKPELRQEWEHALEYACLDRAIYQRDQTVMVICRDEMPGSRAGSVRLQQPDGVIFGRMDVTFKAKAQLEGLLGAQLAAGRMQAVLTPSLEDYYTQGFRARRVLPFTVNMGINNSEPVGTYDERLITVMRAADRSNDPLYAEIAKMALGWWDALDPGGIRRAIERVKRCELDCLDDLLGLVAMRLRMGHYKQFPADILAEVDACLLTFNYAPTLTTAVDLSVESNQVTLYAAQILAGQIFGTRTMAVSHLTGRQERNRGEKLARDWLRRHAQTGFALWNSHIERTVGALALLADSAKSGDIRNLAVVLLDKMLFGLAVNSFRGAYAAPRAEARASWLRSGALAPEAPLNYLLWGVGGHNAHVKGAVGLGLAGAHYQTPELIRTIALDRWPDMLSRERQQIADNKYVNTVTFKTPDTMLASAQDYRAGQRGRREHVWQATMGYDAIVFTNHPTSFSDADARQAGWWCGNGSLPRVAQWRDALIAIYNLPEGDPLGFTHAFFPSYAFDEHVIEQGWAFARKGEGYLALRAAQGMTQVATGNDALRELRSAGVHNAWLCQMGRAEVDGSFEDFRRAVLAKSVIVNDLQVEWNTIRSERLAFGWSGPLLVNGREEPITGFKHVENPYALAEFPAQSMDIGYGEDMMRLHFA
ncbi:MAG: hypothetical protein NT169_12400 [Chloroflexi bacterium]|nr:hypothetical protein [Chloroflexota bacterium]